VFCWERKLWAVGYWPVAAEGGEMLKSPQIRCKQKGKQKGEVFPQLTNPMVSAEYKSVHLVFYMFMVTYTRTSFKPRCCLNFQSMRTQAKSADIAHTMLGQIKVQIPWYNNQHKLVTRKRDGKPRMIGGLFVVVRVGWGPLTQRLPIYLSSYSSNLFKFSSLYVKCLAVV